MDWRREGDMLEQILALLVSFAGLADRAAGLPLVLQLPLFAFLARGEAVGRSFIASLPSGAPALVAASRTEDRAERLAADFRMLARLLRALLAQARRVERFASRPAADLAACSTAPHGRSRPEDIAAAPTAPDTS